MSSDFEGKKGIKKIGPNLYKVSVKEYSRIDPKICKQLQRKVIGSFNEAKKVHRELQEEALREVIRREQVGSLWGQLTEDFFTGLLTKTIFISKNFGPRTLEDYSQALKKYTKHWWRLPAADITPADVKRLFHEVAFEHNRSIAVQQKLKAAINIVFEWGIESRRIRNVSFSPAANIKLAGRKTEKQPEILTQKQISQFLRLAKEFDHPWFAIWFLAIHTGARSGELYALLWCDIDFEGQRIFINKSYSKRTNSIGPTKAGYWRDVPINSELMKFLKELRLQSSGRENVLPHLTDWTRGEQAKILRAFLAQVGLPQVKFHTLRACFATHLLRHKVAPVIVMKICGWKDLETMQRYIRLAGIEVEDATDSLKFMSEEKVLGVVVEIFGRQD